MGVGCGWRYEVGEVGGPPSLDEDSMGGWVDDWMKGDFNLDDFFVVGSQFGQCRGLQTLDEREEAVAKDGGF